MHNINLNNYNDIHFMVRNANAIIYLKNKSHIYQDNKKYS